jgi:hypothetical protein
VTQARAGGRQRAAKTALLPVPEGYQVYSEILPDLPGGVGYNGGPTGKEFLYVYKGRRFTMSSKWWKSVLDSHPRDGSWEVVVAKIKKAVGEK